MIEATDADYYVAAYHMRDWLDTFCGRTAADRFAEIARRRAIDVLAVQVTKSGVVEAQLLLEHSSVWVRYNRYGWHLMHWDRHGLIPLVPPELTLVELAEMILKKTDGLLTSVAGLR